jgi:hypothetical protein
MEVIDFLNSLKNTVTGHTTDITSNLLRKDKADATPYTLGVATSATMNDAVQRKELIGGVLRPYRNFKNVGTTFVGATVRANQEPTIIDTLGLGTAYKVTNIRVTTVTAPTLATVITIKNNGVTIYTQTLALVNIPAVGKAFDVLGFTNSYPADVTLPALLTVSSSAGVFDIFVDGVQV